MKISKIDGLKMFYFFLLLITCIGPLKELQASDHFKNLACLTNFSNLALKRSIELENCSLVVLSDESTWMVKHPPFENQSWIDWWQGIDHCQPDTHFYFQLNQWNKDAPIQIYSYDVAINEVNDSIAYFFQQYPELPYQFPFIIENLGTGEMAFCRPLSRDEFIDEIQSFNMREMIRKEALVPDMTWDPRLDD